MLPTPKPDLDVATVYAACISKARPAAMRTRLQDLSDIVAAAAAEYETAAAAAAAHTLAHLHHQPDGKAGKDGGVNKQLTGCYTSRMVHKNGAGREFYNELLERAPDGRCALCGHGIADTLDHQLPKIAYPLLAVAPANLVPACRGCNSLRGEMAPQTAEEQTLHPYFDDLGDHVWLTARVGGLPKPAVTFHAVPPPAMPEVMAARVRLHFTTLKLGKLYGSQVGPELRSLSHTLRGKHPTAVPGYLTERAEGWHRENPNCWQAALYRGLSTSEWYTEGGHQAPW